MDKNKRIIENFIKSFDLELTHIHPNNYGKLDLNNDPSIIELTFEKYLTTQQFGKIDTTNNPPNFLDNHEGQNRNRCGIRDT